MKNLALILAILIISFSAKAEDLKSLPLKDFYGQDVTLEDYNFNFRDGMIINVWATWCTPCVKELPSLMRLQQLLPTVTVVAVNVDDNMNKAKQFLHRNKLPNSVIVNLFDQNAKQFSKLGVSNLPVTYIINNEGKLVDTIQGFKNWAYEINVAQVKTKLKMY